LHGGFVSPSFHAASHGSPCDTGISPVAGEGDGIALEGLDGAAVMIESIAGLADRLLGSGDG